MLVNILRTGADQHRPLPADSDLAQAIAVLARAQQRAHQDAVWNRTQAHNKLRSHLREYHPAVLIAFATNRDGLLRPEARAILAATPTPAEADQLTKPQATALLRQAGRKRSLQAGAERLQAIFRSHHLRQPPLVEQALGHQAQALLAQRDAVCRAVVVYKAAGWQRNHGRGAQDAAPNPSLTSGSPSG